MSSSLIIKIPLPPSLVEPATNWAKRLNSGDFCQMADAQVVGNSLLANAYDLCDLVEISDSADASELDLRRFKTAAIKSLEHAIAQSEYPKIARSMKDALAWLRKATPENAAKMQDLPQERAYVRVPLVQ